MLLVRLLVRINKEVYNIWVFDVDEVSLFVCEFWIIVLYMKWIIIGGVLLVVIVFVIIGSVVVCR